MDNTNNEEKKYIIRSFNVKDKILTVKAAISKINPTFIDLPSKRPSGNLNSKGTFIMSCSINEFLEELEFMCNYLDKNRLDSISLMDSYLALIEKHISEFNQLIDSDMYSYIDKTILLQNSILQSYNNKVEEESEIASWNILLNVTIKMYSDYVYVTKYDTNDILNIKPYLVKFSELDK